MSATQEVAVANNAMHHKAADGQEFMEMIMYGNQAGWNKPTQENVGHKGLIERAIRSRRYNENVDDEQVQLAEGVIADVNKGEELKTMLEEARKTYLAAVKLLDDGLSNCVDWLGLRDRFYDAGSIFAICGFPDEAAKCFIHATFINRAFQDDDEAVQSMTMCVENLRISHPVLTVDCLTRLATCYDQSKLDFQAARCRKEAADILDCRLEKKEEAIAMYAEAITSYRKTKKYNMHTSLSTFCQERMCFLHTELGHYEEAEKLFLEHARSIPHNLPATRYFMYATLAVLARGSGSADKFFDTLYHTRKVFDSLQEQDLGYQKGKENQLIRKILGAYDHISLNEFDMALLEYKTYTATKSNAAFDIVATQCRENLYEQIERFS